MATVLLPSNFKSDSFSCIPELVETFPGMPLKVLFFHPFGLSSSITELLLLSRRSREEALVSFDFFSQCMAMEKSYPEVTSVKWTCFYGTTLVAFKRFLQANTIDFIASPTSYQYLSIAKQSLNPSLFLEKCGLPIIQITPQDLVMASANEYVL